MDFADDPLLVECYILLPPLPIHDTYPTDYHWIFAKQSETDEMLKCKQKFLTSISLRYLMTKKSTAMLHPVMTKTF